MIRRVVTAMVALLVLLTAAAGIYAADARRDHDRAPITIRALPQLPGFASYQPGTWNKTVFMLLIGSDEREGLGGSRGDALHVLGLNPAAGRATILNIPRDTWVDIPGRRQGRINEAFHEGDAEREAETVRRLTGAPISYVITTTFAGFKSMVDGVGGVTVDVPYLMSDPNSGAAFNPGVQHMNGEQALAFSRDRHIPDGDIMRTAHQGQLIVHALTDLRRKGTSSTDVIRRLDTLYRNVKTVGISAVDLFRLGRAALAIDPANVRNYTMPARVGKVGQASVVFVKQPEAGALFADFADDAILQGH
jgi:LCP family protein required for cell wall assembly